VISFTKNLTNEIGIVLTVRISAIQVLGVSWHVKVSLQLKYLPS